jgi:hypothetical protein
MAPWFEAMMLVCFGSAWPTAIVKTFRVKRVDGVSIFFLWLILSGYGAGMAAKLTGSFNWVFALYALNFCMVATEIVLYYRYRLRTPVPARPDL